MNGKLSAKMIVKSLSLKQMAWILLSLCVLDAWLTDMALRTGIAYEANPLVEQLYSLDPQHLWFYFIKISLPLAAVCLTHRVSNQKFVLPFFWLAMGAYAIILFFHAVWITVYVGTVM